MSTKKFSISYSDGKFIFGKEEKGTQNSHVQLNQAMMERFSFFDIDPASGGYKSKVRTVYYLDINNKEIKKEKTKKLGTKFGYFSDQTEIVSRKNRR